MTVSLIVATASQDSAISLPVEVGTYSPGAQSSVIDIYLRHDGTAAITNCKFYVLPYVGVYLGTKTAQDDYDDLLSWGDDSYPAISGGGLFINTNCSGGFPSGDYVAIRTGYGDSLGTAISLPAAAINLGTAVAGEIQPSGEAHLRFRFDIPAGETDTGTFYIDCLLSFSSSS
jgi:hypothetical protein